MPLDKNESYWLLDEELVAAVSEPQQAELSTYPDYSELKRALARYAGVAPEQVLPTAGSVAAIEHIARAYATSGAEVILPVPTFYCYETILKSVGAKVEAIPYEDRDGKFIFPLAKTLAALSHGTARALFLCHPNNPLGAELSREDIVALIEAARGSATLVVSDEAYFEFSSGSSFLPALSELPNLIIIRTLSKAFALSGARVGYVLAAPERLAEIAKMILPWPVAHSSMRAALALLPLDAKVAARRALVLAEREHFREALNAVPGVTVYPSAANFVLARVADAARVRERLGEAGIHVALGEPMSYVSEAQALLKGTLRIAVPAPSAREVFLTALHKALNK